MSKNLQLGTLIDLAQTKNDLAAKQLGLLQRTHTSAVEKLEMLLQYRQEYVEQFNQKMRIGMASSSLSNYQQFISTLGSAIDQQRSLILQSESRLAYGRTEWQSTKRRFKSFTALAERAQTLKEALSNKKEQIDSDERSARKRMLCPSSLAD
jgi:flagellar FliJ protein